MKVSRLPGRERLADCGFFSLITFWTLSKFQTISKSVVERDPPIEVSLDQQVENDSPMGVSLDRQVEKDPRTRVSFGRAESRTIRGLRDFHRDDLLDFEHFSKSAVGRDAPMRSLDWQVENDSPIADLPAYSPFGVCQNFKIFQSP